MSGKVVGWAYDQKTGSPTTKSVLVKLADNANDDGMCWPSLDTIARQTELSRGSVKTHIKKLEAAGFVSIERRRSEDGRVNLSNRYQLNIDGVGQELTHVGQEVTQGRSGADLGVGQELTPNLHLEPSIEPSIEPSLSLRTRSDYPEAFDAFWKSIRGVFHKTPLGNKKEAFNEWKRARDRPPDLTAHWKQYHAHCRQVDQNTKHVCRWIKYRGWEDDYAPAVSTGDMAWQALEEKYRREDEHGKTDSAAGGHSTVGGRISSTVGQGQAPARIRGPDGQSDWSDS